MVLAAVAVLISGGAAAWQVYEDHQQAKAWEALLESTDCSACAARKQGIAKKQKAKREAEAAAAGGVGGLDLTGRGEDVAMIAILNRDKPHGAGTD